MKHSSEQGEYRKYRKQTGYGKGDKRRPTNEKVYRENFEDINWHRNEDRDSVARRPKSD